MNTGSATNMPYVEDRFRRENGYKIIDNMPGDAS